MFDRTADPTLFFDILPADWQEEIVSHWEDYRYSARVFTLEKKDEILGGGILFSTVSPDTRSYREEAQYWLDRGYLYIGFLWIAEPQRGRGLGSRWLEWVQEILPDSKYWLTIDDYELAPFYERHGFRVVQKIDVGAWEEWILVKNSDTMRRK